MPLMVAYSAKSSTLLDLRDLDEFEDDVVIRTSLLDKYAWYSRKLRNPSLIIIVSLSPADTLPCRCRQTSTWAMCMCAHQTSSRYSRLSQNFVISKNRLCGGSAKLNGSRRSKDASSRLCRLTWEIAAAVVADEGQVSHIVQVYRRIRLRIIA